MTKIAIKPKAKIKKGDLLKEEKGLAEPVKAPKEVKMTPIAGESELKKVDEGTIPEPTRVGLEVIMPSQATIIYGGPVLKGVKHPFGFSVRKENDPVKGNESKYGVGKGVVLHGNSAEKNDYKIIYED